MKCEICGHSGQLGNGTHTCGGVAVTEKKGMSIIDAVKSGKPFRRIGTKDWLLFDNEDTTWSFDRITLLATDWEIEEKKIEITEARFDYVVNSLVAKGSLVESIYEIKRRLFEL